MALLPRQQKAFPVLRPRRADATRKIFAAAASFHPPAFPESSCPRGTLKKICQSESNSSGNRFDDLWLLQIAYGYEQASRKRHSPQTTPPLPGEKFTY